MAQRTCSIDGCERKHKCRGWCGTHYSRWQRHGDPTKMVMAERGEPLAWLIATAPVQTDECVPWPFAKISDGYGNLFHDGRSTLATHLALTLSGAPRPPAPNNHALHSCDNPPCVNPRHLRWGSNAENAEDRRAHGRHHVGESRPNHKLTEADVRRMRELRSAGVVIREIAARFGVSQQHTSLILAGRKWKHVT